MAIVLDQMQNPASFSAAHHSVDRESNGSWRWTLNGVAAFPLKVKTESGRDSHEEVNLYLYFPEVGVGRGVLIDESEPSATINEVIQEPDRRVSSAFTVEWAQVVRSEPAVPQASLISKLVCGRKPAGSYAMRLAYEVRIQGRVAEAPHPVFHRP